MSTIPMSNLKKAENAYQLQFEQQAPGLRGTNIFASHYPIEPFLVFTEFYMDRPVFGPHPHAGISVLTYILPDSAESFINRDSNGDFSFINPGGLHITQAGSGIQHDEFPKTTGNVTHGFQIWINHADKDRIVKPKAMHAESSDIPEAQNNDFTLRVLHGQFEGKAPSYKMVTEVTLFHVFLQPGKSILLDAEEMAFAYGLTGSGMSDGKHMSKQTLLVYEVEGNSVHVEAGDDGLEFMFGTAMPLNEPIVYGGPFVMTTAEQMLETKRRYASGQMGSLQPYRQ